MLTSQQRFQQIQNLQNNTKNIRNISIVAHVDHGKTTLSDSLLATNNIVHQKSVGKLRFLDSRKDEQERGITMKSSSISLLYKNKQSEDHLINLIDSPGHVEFSSEVSAALRITDGALVLVDVIEGVSAQTYTVIRQCYQERVKSILVLNKIDRLIWELQMSPLEAFIYLSQIIEQVNAIIAKLVDIEKDSLVNKKKKQDEKEKEEEETKDNQQSLEDEIYENIENQLYFAPEKGNIVFGSAIHQWAFTTNDFAEIFAKKMGANKKFLQKVLYGDYYYNPKTKQVTKKQINSKQKPMFVDFILNNIWTVYERVQNHDVEGLNKLTKSLKINPVEKKYMDNIGTEQNNIVQNIMKQWLPLEKSILECVIEYLPSPIQAQEERIEIISKELAQVEDTQESQQDFESKEKHEQFLKLKQAIAKCDNSVDAPLVIFISKMLFMPQSNINERSLKSMQEIKDGPQKRFIAFARIFSGRMVKNKQVYVVQPKKNSQGETKIEVEQVQIQDVYLMMSQYLDGIQECGAGNIVALGNLDQIVFKSATLSSENYCPTLLPINLGSKSILKVSLMAKDFKEQAILVEGLKKLNKFDPSVEVFMEANGNVILATCGQVHLERCVTDLEEMTQVEIKTSEPIVSFKETIVYKKLRQTKNFKKQKGDDFEQEYEEEVFDTERKVAFLKKMSDVMEEDIVDNTKEELEELDIRYNLVDIEEYNNKKEGKKTVTYQQDREIKRLDYFNSGKALAGMSLVNLLEVQKKPNLVTMKIPNQKIQFTVRCLGMNFTFAQWLEQQGEVMRKIFQTKQASLLERKQFLKEFEEQMQDQIKDKGLHQLIRENMLCFGPDKFGPNMLIKSDMNIEDSVIQKLKNSINIQQQQQQQQQQQEQSQKDTLIQEQENQEQKQDKELQENKQEDQNSDKAKNSNKQNSEQLNKLINEFYSIRPEEINNSIISGFEMAVVSGPLCQEPMMGAIFILEDIKYLSIEENNENKQKDSNKENTTNNSEQQQQQQNNEQKEQEEEKEEEETKQDQEQENKDSNNNIISQESLQNDKDCYGPISGQINSTIKESCWESFLGACPRLVEGMYLCHLQCDTETYPKVWDVLNRRRAKPIQDDLQESSNLFIISAHLPVIESFNFYSEMQIKTSGRVNAQLVFDTWHVLDVDPFFVPTTQEEIEEHGDKVQTPNFAKALIDKIRKRKGINVEEKIVESAEKQNNISRKR